ncbi:hypothetical protein GOODEAATRI_004227 [Goodea atripinnis]|uniref:Uncharacterized protein n=1 Tax=Goodea atripinnis TaxID=208336 RepID=A0ABV0PB92_9TELE
MKLYSQLLLPSRYTSISFVRFIAALGKSFSRATSVLPMLRVSPREDNRRKKDAEGWETVQRGRTAKPRSAAMVAKVSPALAHVPAKQDSAKCNRSHLPEKQQLRPECPPDKDVTQTDSGQQVTVKPVLVEELEHPQNGHIMEPPAEPVQHSEQCVDAPFEDVPPPVASLVPSQASECPQSKAAVPPTDIITVSIPVCAQTITSSVDLHQTNGLSNLLAFGDAGAEGGASQGMTTSAPGQAEAPMAAVKLESVLDPTELSTTKCADGTLLLCLVLSIAEVLAKKEELADRLEKANEEAIASAIAEEEQLTREIQAENNDLETDNESDFTEKDVRKWKEQLLDQRRKMMEEKLLHAEFKRELQLQAIVKKAQEEEAKVEKGILEKFKQCVTSRIYQERKRVLEAERQARVEELLTRRKEQEARIEQQRQEKEKAREDAARERASHTKGKRHQQAVRDSSSIQGRELSDEEVVRITNMLRGTNILPCCCLCYVNRQSETAVVLCDVGDVIVYASYYICLSTVACFG